MKKINPSAYFLIVVIVVMAVLFVTSLSYDEMKVKLMPALMSGATIVFALIALVTDLRKKGTMPTDDEGDVVEDETKIKTPLSAYFKAFGWMVAAILLVYFLGFVIAFPVWIVVYMVKNGYQWWKSIVTGVVYIAIVYAIFVAGFQIELYQGLAGEFIYPLLGL
jgi:cell division protein FtsW (lipid II flippase)